MVGKEEKVYGLKQAEAFVAAGGSLKKKTIGQLRLWTEKVLEFENRVPQEVDNLTAELRGALDRANVQIGTNEQEIETLRTSIGALRESMDKNLDRIEELLRIAKAFSS